MPRFFFNVHDGSDHPDLEGLALPDLPAARAAAVRYAGDLLRDHASEFWNGHEWTMDVMDEQGLILFTLMFHAIDSPVTSNVTA